MKRFYVRDRDTGEVGFRTNYFLLALLAAVYLTIKDYFSNRNNRKI